MGDKLTNTAKSLEVAGEKPAEVSREALAELVRPAATLSPPDFLSSLYHQSVQSQADDGLSIEVWINPIKSPPLHNRSAYPIDEPGSRPALKVAKP